jgi:hypothetical protein
MVQVLAATIIRAHRPDDGGSKHFRNVGKLLSYYTAKHPEDIFTLAAVRT